LEVLVSFGSVCSNNFHTIERTGEVAGSVPLTTGTSTTSLGLSGINFSAPQMLASSSSSASSSSNVLTVFSSGLVGSSTQTTPSDNGKRWFVLLNLKIAVHQKKD